MLYNIIKSKSNEIKRRYDWYFTTSQRAIRCWDMV